MGMLGPAGTAELLNDYRAFAGRRFGAAVALMIGGALAEGLGIVALIPLLALAGDAADLPGALRGIGEGLGRSERFALALGVFVAAMLARSLLLYRRDRTLSRLRAGYEASLKLRSARSLAAQGWEQAARVGQAGMQSLLLNDIPRCALAIYYFQIALVATIMLAVQFALAALLSPAMAAVALVMVAAGLFASRVWVARGERSGFALSGVSERSSAAAFRLHAGLKAALAQGTVPQFLREYRSTLGDLTREVVSFERDRALAQALASSGAAVGAVLLLVIGDVVLELPLPLLLAMLVLFARMSAPAQQLQQSVQGLAVHVPAYVGVREHIESGTAELVETAGVPLRWRTLSIEEVSYAHAGGKGVDAVNLELEQGQWVGLSGPSGAGKTTLVDLVAGLLRPQQGRVLVDDRPLDGKLMEQWRGGLAYVGQTDTVFDDTVRGNLLAEGSAADDESMWTALEAVGLAERVQALPGGLDQHVGDRGSSLSGGELQPD